MIKKDNRINEISYNKYGSKMMIIEYNRSDNLIVEFENGYKVKTNYQAFKKGEVKNPYDKSVDNIGYRRREL